VQLHTATARHNGHHICNTNLLYNTNSHAPLLATDTKHQAVGACSTQICAEEDEEVAPCGRGACTLALSAEAAVVLTGAEAPGHLRLVNTTYFVRENLWEGSVLMSVQRVGGSRGNVSVCFETHAHEIAGVSVSAVAGVDYEGVSGVVGWGDGDVEDKVISVKILNDDVYVAGRLKRSFNL